MWLTLSRRLVGGTPKPTLCELNVFAVARMTGWWLPSGQITLRQGSVAYSLPKLRLLLCRGAEGCRFLPGRDAYDLTKFEADHARLDDLFWFESRLPERSMFWRV